jgi:hypothetical protein
MSPDYPLRMGINPGGIAHLHRAERAELIGNVARAEPGNAGVALGAAGVARTPLIVWVRCAGRVPAPGPGRVPWIDDIALRGRQVIKRAVRMHKVDRQAV